MVQFARACRAKALPVPLRERGSQRFGAGAGVAIVGHDVSDIVIVNLYRKSKDLCVYAVFGSGPVRSVFVPFLEKC